ncbi:DUF7848 domain-containing protein [Streptomyces roseolilacinus]|uniref:DUF7848 domain-containing protein n=1 Tax=Streptomyces roseolilacinus TaxID=66904 RepID=A0A918AW54_9ACTN|nr:hypothetical protein GCM10010249_08070 [Streptomyces roseolilacinus]
MSPRAVYRHVTHTIRRAPEGGITYEAFCAAPGCGAEFGPHVEQEAAQNWALRHTGRVGHDLFRRVFTDHAKVTRAE